ncbi:serine/threonine protein phosphatase PrpC [Thiogranum longum]|uniref:Serine/threonine protein phosphatase PrpC n=1 Tax=Thiogranum longum TaxID=1537524 RepID=A0A4R1H5N8_9GAMM|nr:protein phosphatase 2C domain-containing protein [Thiogranum longum]TCK17037.1 serine/threonine protein phosphatase PrpC [Thiogranum longum]
MKTLVAATSRLGNRSSNQDRCLVEKKPGHVLLVVADGMGGHARGDLAAQTTIDSLARSFQRASLPVSDPQAFLKQAIHTAHLDVVDTGRSHNPPITPRTTCVVCLVQNDTAYWAHVGDSRLYLLRAGELFKRTRDHTPVEELFQSGLVSEEELRNHPLRNSVNRCLGGSPRFPEISFDQEILAAEDILLLCSDGLWSAVPESLLVSIQGPGELEQSLSQLAGEAESASYPNSDNISGVVLRWLAADRSFSATGQDGTAPDMPVAESTENKDELEQAIEDIHRAMLEYASEMKK